MNDKAIKQFINQLIFEIPPRTQGEPIVHLSSWAWTWADVKLRPDTVRGDLCVIRGVNGKPVMFKIVEQHTYKEWVGCFSFI